MADAADATPPAAIDAAPAWRSGLRWFVAEFVVVVAGVLAALAVSAWAGDRHDRGREQAYLQQLSTDLAAAEITLQAGTDFHRERAEASARVLHRFWVDAPVLDETFVKDLSLPRTMMRFRPVLGTIDALVATGDLNLVRSDPLRTAILAHLESARAIIGDIERYDETYYRPAVAALYQGPDLFQFSTFTTTDDTILPRPNVTERVPFPATLAEMARDRRIYDGYVQLLVAHRNPASRYGDLLEETRALKALVDAQIE